MAELGRVLLVTDVKPFSDAASEALLSRLGWSAAEKIKLAQANRSGDGKSILGGDV